MNERLGIVEEAQRRREVYGRFIGRRVAQYVAKVDVAAMVKKEVSDRVKREVDRIMAETKVAREAEIEKLQARAAFIEDVVKEAAAITGYSVGELISPWRPRSLARARQFAYWLMKKRLPHLSLPQIGRAFLRDHTSVLHGLRVVEREKGSPPMRDWIAAVGQ